jgi:hypothetical protein
MGLESSMTSLRANLMTKLKGFMTDRTVLVTEQLSLGNSKVDKQRKILIYVFTLPLCLPPRVKSSYFTHYFYLWVKIRTTKRE